MKYNLIYGKRMEESDEIFFFVNGMKRENREILSDLNKRNIFVD